MNSQETVRNRRGTISVLLNHSAIDQHRTTHTSAIFTTGGVHTFSR